MTAIKCPLKLLLIPLLWLLKLCCGQQTNVMLDQGALVGLKVFPDSARTAVYAFLGVPFAQPPTGELRFAPPKPHNGWNWTLQATRMKPICPQLIDSVYDETPDSSVAGNLSPHMDEDCLYLNIWVSEVGMRFGNLPVLVIITGEQMAFDWSRNRPSGLDFAAEGVVVVTVQYRSNIFGWISLGSQELAGNYGLQDQQLALQWIQRNVQQFGGNPRQVTLLGHGTSGAPCVLAHLLNDRVVPADALFARVILMSGGDVEAALATNTSTLAASRLLVQKLGCQFEVPSGQVVKCLRSKSVSDLQLAFESIYDHGNGSQQLGLVLNRELRVALTNKTWLQHLPPIMLGICSNEGAFLQDYWLDLARDGYAALSDYVNYTIMPHALQRYAKYGDASARQLADAISWKFLGGEAAVSTSYLLHSMQRLLSELNFEMPFYQLLEHWAETNVSGLSAIYAYVFEASNTMDLRGKLNLFGGASHSSDLPLLLGPSLFQQIARRRFTANEDKLCRKLRATFASFVKNGNPTPGRLNEAWLPYTRERKFVYNLGNTVREDNELTPSSDFEKNLPQIDKLLEKEKSALSRPNRNDYRNPYQLPAGAGANDVRRTKSASYLSNQLDSGYALHLKQVYGFWQLMLPNMAVYGGNNAILTDELSQRVRLMEASADAQRYRQGFFALLGLVCVLLAVLGLCVYLLRRDPLRLPSRSSQGFRL